MFSGRNQNVSRKQTIPFNGNVSNDFAICIKGRMILNDDDMICPHGKLREMTDPYMIAELNSLKLASGFFKENADIFANPGRRRKL